MRDFGYLIGDDAEVFFYLYNGTSGAMQQISERFSIFIPKEGYTHFNEKLHSNCCVFTDLGKKKHAMNIDERTRRYYYRIIMNLYNVFFISIFTNRSYRNKF